MRDVIGCSRGVAGLLGLPGLFDGGWWFDGGWGMRVASSGMQEGASFGV